MCVCVCVSRSAKTTQRIDPKKMSNFLKQSSVLQDASIFLKIGLRLKIRHGFISMLIRIWLELSVAVALAVL